MGIALEGRIKKLEEMARPPCEHEKLPFVIFIADDMDTCADAERYEEIIKSCPRCSKADHPLMIFLIHENPPQPKPEPMSDGHLTIGDGEKLFGE